MFKVSRVSTLNGLDEACQIMRRIYDENPSHWPNGLSAGHFDGGLYLIREKQSSVPAGFCGWQERIEPSKQYPFLQKIGYYSIGILPEYRRNGFAREAVSKIVQLKSAGVDKVRALIMASNNPSLALADDLGVEKVIKLASTSLMDWFAGLLRPRNGRHLRVINK
jgi:RimJ/RimL family protein N-acetyltransferase